MASASIPAVELLDVHNYATWRSKIKFLLITKGLWTAVTGESTDRDVDAKALAQIGLHVKDHHLPVLESCTTAKAAWEKLEAVYQAKSNARKRQLRKELAQLKMGAAEPLTKYVARAKQIQNQLKSAGYDVGDQEVVWALLAGLPPTYDTVVTVLEASTDSDIKLDDILPKLMPVEQRLTSPESAAHESAALVAERKSGLRGNWSERYKSSNRYHSNQEPRTCYVCGDPNHLARNCPRKSGGRPGAFTTIVL